MSTTTVTPALSDMLDRIAFDGGGAMLDKRAMEASDKLKPMIAAVRAGMMPKSLAQAAAEAFSAMMYREVVLHFLKHAALDTDAPHVLVVGHEKGATS